MSPVIGKVSGPMPASTGPAPANVGGPEPSRLAVTTTVATSAGTAPGSTCTTSPRPWPWCSETPGATGWLKNTKSASERTRPSVPSSSAETSSGQAQPIVTVTGAPSPGSGRFSPLASAVTPSSVPPRPAGPTS